MPGNRIVALRGATNREIQATLADFARRMMRRGVGVAGVVEVVNDAPSNPCDAFVLQDLVTARVYPIYQNLGPGSTACRLDARGVVAACEAVCRQIRRGCDLVVLSKFAKLEAARTGLTDAFALAAHEGLPIATAVSPMFAAEWERFSAPLATFLAPRVEVLEAWWEAIEGPRPCRRPSSTTASVAEVGIATAAASPA